MNADTAPAPANSQAQDPQTRIVDEKEVRRLLDPHYGSKLEIQLLGQRLVIVLEAVRD